MAAIPQINWANVAASTAGVYAVWTENAASPTRVRYSTVLSHNSTPASPTSLTQLKNDASTTISNGGYTNETNVKLKASATDADTSEVLNLFFEAVANASSFTSTATPTTAGSCASGTAFADCASKVWYVTSSSGDYSSTPYTGTVNVTGLSDGTGYKWQAKACDDSSTCSSWVAFNASTPNFIIDTSAPSVPGTPSTTSPTSDTTPTWTFTASTDSGSGLHATPYTVQWCTDSGFSGCAANTSTSTTNSFTHSTALADGTWYLRVKAKDAIDNESSYSSNGSVNINTSAPTGSISINSGASYTSTRAVTLTVSATDDSDSASSLTMKVSNSSDLSDASYETYAASKSWTLTTTDGTKTVYVKFKDSVGNESGTHSDTIVFDATEPSSFDLDSPGDNSYTNSERPSFKWKAASTPDATSGLSKYKLEIDNGDSGDFTIDDIPTSRTTEYSTNKYLILYENFDDSDNSNNYISIHTKSSSDWSSSENDGKLKEGKRYWKVKAVDNAGNEREQSRTLFVDRSGPSVEVTQINDASFTDSLATTDTTPTVYGKVTDSLNGDKTDNKVASGPKEVEIKFEKRNYLGVYSLHTLATVNINDLYWSSDGSKITDNSKQTSNKYSSFSYTPTNDLPLGTYKITLTGKDKADNGGGTASFTLTIKTFEEIAKIPEVKKTIEELEKEMKVPKEKIEEIIKKQGVVVPEELQKPSVIAEGIGKIIGGVTNLWWQTVDTGKFLTGKIGQGLAFVDDKTGKAIAFVGKATNKAFVAIYNDTRSILAAVGQGIGNEVNAVGQGLAFAGEKAGQGISTAAKGTGNLLASIGQGIGNTGKAIGQGYNQLANNAPGVTKTILIGIGNGVAATTSTIASAAKYTTDTTVTLAQNTASTIRGMTHAIITTTSTIAQNSAKTIGNITSPIVNMTSTIAKNTGSAIASATWIIGKTANQQTAKLTTAWQTTRESIRKPASEEAQNLATRLKIATSTFIAIVFDKEPTKISDIRVEEVTLTSAAIVWRTNHYASGKINYGFSTTYGKELFSDARAKEHRFILKDLEPGKLYYFEVMSQNKNYVYDAYYTFTTPDKGSEKVKGAVSGEVLATVIGDEGNWVLVRDAPSLKDEVLAKVAVGQSFPLLEKKDGWVKIKLDGQEGWVFGELVKIGGGKHE